MDVQVFTVIRAKELLDEKDDEIAYVKRQLETLKAKVRTVLELFSRYNGTMGIPIGQGKLSVKEFHEFADTLMQLKELVRLEGKQ